MAPKPKRINLALQGGGAHGAFTWGVLDCLLETPEIEIAAISGTSAGALNGAALKAGLCDGRAAAQDILAWVWERVGAITDQRLAPWLEAISPASINTVLESSPGYHLADATARMFSPYDSGPFYQNPLEPIVRALDFEQVCSDTGPRLVICATNVRSGKIRLFSGADISPSAIMASACLPTMARAVEITDTQTGRTEAYWDGGYTGNPALFPLFAKDLPTDVLIVNINPLWRDEVPRTAREIQNRINEISFNSSLLRELRAIDFVKRLIADGTLENSSMRDILIHMVSDDALMQQLSVATKLIATPSTLHQLRSAGHAACAAFLDAHFDKIGVSSSLEPRTVFQ